MKMLKAAALRRTASIDGIELSTSDALVFVEAFPTLKAAQSALLAAKSREFMPQLRQLFILARRRLGLP